ncbi:hypothetical protein CDO52_22440 [Nocardiopsis gilva YIM 90087]|uniref:Spore-associated protein A n=1 Tax=Nocardiopsis gilva YIM 90087 TaxID=1235441 RepID=A0A223SAM9_9ACTN|nr:hypothetical protein [Nocardiopsis gilva]ASU85184.1 hypothetical protein CDO52_22440 [Nocardiopsis gilva YIM 90087]
MKNSLRTLLVATVACAGLGAGAVASPAVAAANPYTAKSVCGSGYYQVDRHRAPSGASTTYLMYNGSSNCVVTIKNRDVGTPTHVWASLQRQSPYAIAKDDGGPYAYYAGPVRLRAKATCVKWGGGPGSTSGSRGDLFVSGWGHCG